MRIYGALGASTCILVTFVLFVDIQYDWGDHPGDLHPHGNFGHRTYLYLWFALWYRGFDDNLCQHSHRCGLLVMALRHVDAIMFCYRRLYEM